jgi:hypothetical protein
MWTQQVSKAISTRSSEPSPCLKRCGTHCNCRGYIPLSEDSTRGLRHHPVIFSRPSIVPIAERPADAARVDYGPTPAVSQGRTRPLPFCADPPDRPPYGKFGCRPSAAPRCGRFGQHVQNAALPLNKGLAALEVALIKYRGVCRRVAIIHAEFCRS